MRRVVWLGLAMLTLAPRVAAAEPSNPVYDKNCAVCHQAGAVGVPGAFPRLAGRVGALASLPAGRTAIASTVLWGASGSVQADNQRIMGVMPGLGQLSDADIAGVLTYLAHLSGGRAKTFTAAEIAGVRKRPPLSPSEVSALYHDPALMKAAP